MDNRPTVPMSDDLKRRINQARAEEAAETGDIPPFSVWMRQAAEEKLARTTTKTKNPQSEEGAA